MPQTVIENPILNSPFQEPSRHFKFSEDGITKTGAGNLFMVFGEPDIDIRIEPDRNLVVEIRGLDVYDPTTARIRSSSTDDIACWTCRPNRQQRRAQARRRR